MEPLTLKVFIALLLEFAKENPDLLDKPVVTSKDDEGNGFSHVYFTPVAGYFDGDDFTAAKNGGRKVNSVCVN